MKRPPLKPYASKGVPSLQKKIQIKSGNGDIIRRSSGLTKQYLNVNEKNGQTNGHIANNSSQTIIIQDQENSQKRKSLKLDLGNPSNKNINGNIKKPTQQTPKKLIKHD